jgi:hypothetical protein
MAALLEMPIPFASALIVLMMVAAFFFIKFLALAIAPADDEHLVHNTSNWTRSEM